MNTAFSTFTNTIEDPVLLDEDDSDDFPVINHANEDHQLQRVRNRNKEDHGSSTQSTKVVVLGTDATMSSQAEREKVIC
ncbi:hypothetical protein L6452_17835 [Arctium lappa]|uniref:Uncharacterized protein n=1 Tax=Arctium lappa TaxID=4217 RepID=A0ACB9C4R6_ARCLA|nr:hypothetical protein L6452_17835 [Arctium lappa]